MAYGWEKSKWLKLLVYFFPFDTSAYHMDYSFITLQNKLFLSIFTTTSPHAQQFEE